MPLTEISAEVLVDDEDGLLSVNASGWSSMPIADTGRSWDEGAARAALNSWAGDDLGKYGRAFLWKGATKSDMKFPIAMPIDGKLTIVPRAVQAAAGRLNQADIPDGAKSSIGSILAGIRRRYADGESKTMGVHAEVTGITWSGREAFVTFHIVDENGNVLGGKQVDVSFTLEPEPIVAAGGPVIPPAQWFDHQDVKRSPGITVSPEGQVSGYLAAWKQCHMSVGRGRCVKAPRSKTSYQYFHLGSVAVDPTGGTWTAAIEKPKTQIVKVGRLTVGGGHADVSLGILPATEHYDNAGTQVAVVRAHEDEYGIQVAGAIVPEATPEQVAALRRSPLSGDWRAVGGNLELCAALAVNVPGFPVFAEDDEGHELSLISGGFMPDTETEHEHVEFIEAPEVTGGDGALSVDVDVDVDDAIVNKVIDVLSDRQERARRAQTLRAHQAVLDARAQQARADALNLLKEV